MDQDRQLHTAGESQVRQDPGEGGRRRTVVLAVWILGFLMGTCSHIVDLAIDGLNAYAQFPAGLRIYWVSLTLLDPRPAAALPAESHPL